MTRNRSTVTEVNMQRNSLWYRVSIVVALIVSLLIVGAAFAQGGTVVRVDPAASSVAPNQTVVIAIKVDNVTNLAAAEIHLSFNKDVLEVTQLANGGLLVADFTAQNTFDNSAGTIDYAIAQMNRPSANGSGTFLSITFRAKASGTSPIGFRGIPAAPAGVILADSNGAAIAATLTPGSVTVTGGGTTPPAPTNTSAPAPTNTPNPAATATPQPAATATPMPGATPASFPILGNHTVKYGESLYCIGRAYVVSPWSIAQVNGIAWPYTIFVGQVLKIPNAPWINPPFGPVCQRQFGTPSPTATPGPTPTPGPGTCRVRYTVVFGDTLYSIAVRYNSTVWAIGQANGILNLNLIYPGQVLCIP
jgi:LysM repeat protein